MNTSEKDMRKKYFFNLRLILRPNHYGVNTLNFDLESINSTWLTTVGFLLVVYERADLKLYFSL